jgi:type III secretion protein L
MTLAALFPEGGISPAPGAQILKADEYAAFVESRDLLAAARTRVDALLQQAEAECEVFRREAVEQGLAEGKAEIAMQMLDTVASSVEQLAGMESSLVDIVMRSLRTILGKFDHDELVAQVVSHALRMVRDEKKVLLRVAVEDADAVTARIDGIVRQYPGMGRVDIAPDAALTPGQCVLETEIGVVDASLERQLAMIEENFRRHIEGNPGQ